MSGTTDHALWYPVPQLLEKKKQCLLCTSLLYSHRHVHPKPGVKWAHEHTLDPLWPGMTWNGMLKYVHCSKYSPSVSRLQLFLIWAVLCLVVSFGICSHFQSKKKKKKGKNKETERDGGWCARSATNLTPACPVIIFGLELCYRCWTAMLVRNGQ